LTSNSNKNKVGLAKQRVYVFSKFILFVCYFIFICFKKNINKQIKQFV
jgi:hypothetical protein